MSLIVRDPGRSPICIPSSITVPLAGHWTNGGYWDARHGITGVSDGNPVSVMTPDEGSYNLIQRGTTALPLLDADGLDGGAALVFEGTTPRELRCDSIVSILTHAGSWSVGVRGICSSSSGNHTVWSLGAASFSGANPNWRGALISAGCEDSQGSISTPATTTADQGSPCSVVYTYEGSTHALNLYLDGGLAGSSPFDFHHVPDATMFTLGCLETGALPEYFPFIGTIRVLAICDSVLSQQDAADLHTAWTT
jgi:hypothetical protein